MTVRTCARCQTTTADPVIVYEVHANTGPGYNVYACPNCAPCYPPQRDPLEVIETLRARLASLDEGELLERILTDDGPQDRPEAGHGATDTRHQEQR
jgi:hypothetical protein